MNWKASSSNMSKNSEWFRKKIESGVLVGKINKNHNHSHELEKVQINGNTIFICPKSHSYQIKKIIEGNKITYKIEN